MSLRTIRGAHHTSLHFILYLFSCDETLERARTRANTNTNAAFIQLTEMMRNGRRGRNFFPPPAGSDRGQRSFIHHGRTRARARAWMQRTIQTLHVFAWLCGGAGGS